MEQADYIERHGQMVYQQPFDATDIRFYGFLLKADWQALGHICDRYLNEPANGKAQFCPAFPYILLAFTTLGKLQSSEPPDHDKGWFMEKEAAFWLLTYDFKNGGLRWFHPYMLVDNPYAFAMGRELYGFHKGMGKIHMPRKYCLFNNFSLRAPVFEKFSPQAKQSLQKIISVKSAFKSADLKHKAMQNGMLQLSKQFFWEHLIKDTANNRLLHQVNNQEIINSIFSIPMIFLKQFRDVTNPHKACYQKLVKANADLTSSTPVKAYPLLGHYYVTMPPCDSYPFREDFGFDSETVKSQLSFYTEFSFHMGNGELI